jgi:DNA-binding transcriptional MerR regulator
MTEELCSIRDVGRRLGIAPHRIGYAHAQEFLPEPQYRIAGKRIYTEADVQRVAVYFAEKSRKKGGEDGNGA